MFARGLRLYLVLPAKRIAWSAKWIFALTFSSFMLSVVWLVKSYDFPANRGQQGYEVRRELACQAGRKGLCMNVLPDIACSLRIWAQALCTH